MESCTLMFEPRTALAIVAYIVCTGLLIYVLGWLIEGRNGK